MIDNPQRFAAAIAQFDAANREDPNRERFEGQEHPRELLYAQRMTRWLERLAPDASEALGLAARCQHLCRWQIPRSDYPMDRRGYLQWRSHLARFHAEKAGEILREVGYDEQTIIRVQCLVRKERLKLDPEAQLLEDVICLVFLESYFADFARKHDEERSSSPSSRRPGGRCPPAAIKPPSPSSSPPPTGRSSNERWQATESRAASSLSLLHSRVAARQLDGPAPHQRGNRGAAAEQAREYWWAEPRYRRVSCSGHTDLP
jgi:hypothetical protein